MEITVQQSKPAAEGEYAITFSSPLGNAFGNWPGSPPTLGATYRVELSTGAPLTWGNDIKASDKREYRLNSAGSKVVINALLEGTEEAGLVFLRIGNTILMVDTLGPTPPVGTFVEAHLQDLTVVDTGI